jgi:hypothetical protein
MWNILIIHIGVDYTMGRIDINLPDELENKLRMEVGRRMGAKRGNFTEAIMQAINMWLLEGKAKRK